MQSDSLTLYKLIILFMLNKVDFPLTNSQLTEFILDKGYTTYFNFQQSIHELMESKMIRQETVRNSSHYHITPTGKETITYFEHKIPPAIIEDAIEFLQNHKYELRNEVKIVADYYPAKKDEYTVECIVKEKDSTLLEIKLNVVSQDQAIAICDNWRENSSYVYSNLMKNLMKNPTTTKEEESN